MRIDELTRDLHEQADEAMASAPPVRMADLRERRTRQRRRLAVTAATAAVLVGTTGVAWLAGTAADPANSHGPVTTTTLAPTPTPTPTTPSPTSTPSSSSSSSSSPSETQDEQTNWQPVECNTPSLGGCDLPASLTYEGRTYTQLGGATATQPVFTGNGVSRELGLSLVPHGGPTLVLVGATGAGPGSQLQLSLNWAKDDPLPGDRLTAVLVAEAPDTQKVVVHDTGTPGQDEVLKIATYLPAG